MGFFNTGENSTKRLLVADDSLTIQKVIRLALSNEGYEIQTVSDGPEASEQIHLFRPHAIMVDVTLPGKSAFELKREYNQNPEPENVKFILMSVADEPVDEAQAAEVGFDGRLIKPFDPAHLRAVLNDSLKLLDLPRSKTKTPIAEPTQSRDFGMQDDDQDELDENQDSADGGIRESTQTISFESDLWKNDRDNQPSSQPSAPPPSPSSLPTSSGGSDDDIRHLTETTIKMSGLDNFEWSVNDQANAIEKPTFSPPPPQPPPVPMNTGRESGPLEPDPVMSISSQLADQEDVTFEFDHLTQDRSSSAYRPPSPPRFSPPPPPASFESSSNEDVISESISPEREFTGTFSRDYASASSQIVEEEGRSVPLSTEQMEELLKKQLGVTIERLAQKLLPDIAERVIKQEIHKLLTQPPGQQK